MNMSADDLYHIRENETFDVPIGLLQPWSIPIMRVKLPLKIVNLMIGLTDAILENDGSRPWGDQLAGQIERETLLPIEILKQAGLSGFFENMVRQYVHRCLCQRYSIDLETAMNEEISIQLSQMWIVSQFENEYNPIHSHNNFDVAGVMYLKMPATLPSKKAHREKDDGSIIFFGAHSGDSKLSHPTLQIRPEVGELYLFSANQLHAVYPFRCAAEESHKERRSVSFNSFFKTISSRY